MVCLNKKFYKKELGDYASVLGSEAAAYYVLAMNNGHTLDLDPEGNPSQLFKDILAACGGNMIRAIQEKSVYYTQAYLKANGDWTLDMKEPARDPSLAVTKNTVSQDILQNDIFGEIRSSLQKNGVDDDDYAMRTAIERTRHEYLEQELADFKDEFRKNQKIDTKPFFQKVIAFCKSPFNFKKIKEPSSDQQKKSRGEAYERFNETLKYLILESIGSHITDKDFKDWFNKKREENSNEELNGFMSFVDMAINDLDMAFNNRDLVFRLLSMLRDFEYTEYDDGINLFGDINNIAKALTVDDISSYSPAQQAYIANFKGTAVKNFIDDIKSQVSPEIKELALMWRNSGIATSVNQTAYDVITHGLESRLKSVQRSRLSHNKDVVYQIKSKIAKLKKRNVYNVDDMFLTYYDFLEAAETELRNAITFLDRCLLDPSKATSQTIMYLQTDVLGYYDYIISNHIAHINNKTGLSDDQLDDIRQLYKRNVQQLLEDVKIKYNQVLDVYCDDVIDKFIADKCPLGDTENHKRVFKAMLRNMIDNGELAIQLEGIFGDANTSSSEIVRMIANMLNDAERKVNDDAVKRGRKLLYLYKKAEGVLSKLGINPKNFGKYFCELDEDGYPTGNFVSGYQDEHGNYVGVNKGEFLKQRRKFESKLRKKYGVPGDEHGNTIWNFDIKGQEDTYNDYMDELDDWLDEHSNRMYTKEYYKAKRRILTRQAREALEDIDSQINDLLEKCTDEEGFVYESDLTPGERTLLHSLRREREELGNPYLVTLDTTGKIIKLEKKTGDALDIAESICEWQAFIKDKTERKPDWTKYNAALAKITDPHKRAVFEAANTVTRLSDKFYERLSNCSTATQTDEYMKIASLRSKIMGYTRDSKGYVNPDLLRLNDDAWAELKRIDEELDARKVRGTKGTENFDDIAVMYPVTMEDPSDPTKRIAVYDYLLYQANVAAATDPNALTDFYNKYCYTKHDKRGNGKLVPLSVFYICGPKDGSYKETVPTNSYTEVVGGAFFNPEYDQNNPDKIQPKAKKYPNKRYAEIMNNEDLRNYYLELLDMMEDAISELPAGVNASVTKMPQVTDNATSILSRYLSHFNLKGFWKSIEHHVVINETDTDLYREDLAKLPNGKFVEAAPIRFISTLSDPTQICCDPTKTVTMFYAMAKNFAAKSKVNPIAEALISRMNGGINGSNTYYSDQSKRAQDELEMYGYGRMQKGLGSKYRKMTTSESIWTKILNWMNRAFVLAMLAGKPLSAGKGFVSAYWNTLNEAFVGRYYDFGDRLWTVGKLLSELPQAIVGIQNGNSRSLVQALMENGSLASSLESTFGDKNKTWIRRMFKHFNMGFFTIGDYATTSIIMTSTFHATRLIPDPKTGKLQFMNEEECIDMFLKNGMTEKEAIKWFEKHSGNHLMKMYCLDKYGNPVLKDKVKIRIDGKKHEINPADFNPDKYKLRVFATAEQRAAIANGTVSEHGKTVAHGRPGVKMILSLRNYMISQGWDRFKSGDTFNAKYYDEGAIRNIVESKTYRGQYNFETGHCEASLKTTIEGAMSDLELHLSEVITVFPMLFKILRYKAKGGKLRRSEMQMIKRIIGDIAGVATFLAICTFALLPMVRKYPDEFIWIALLVIFGGAAVEAATAINITTVLDLFTTATATYGYMKSLMRIIPPIKDAFGLSDKPKDEYNSRGYKYKYKKKWFQDAMTLVRLSPVPGIAGYYETFTPAIPGLDNPDKSPYLKRQAEALNKLDKMSPLDMASPEGIGAMSDAFTTPLGAQGVYDWYSHNAAPMTWLGSRKAEQTEEEKPKSKRKNRRHRGKRRTRKSRD